MRSDLVLLFIFGLLCFVHFAYASNVCTCECCSVSASGANNCLGADNSTFTVDDCESCTTDTCLERFVECVDDIDYFVKARCVGMQNK